MLSSLWRWLMPLPAGAPASVSTVVWAEGAHPAAPSLQRPPLAPIHEPPPRRPS
ncbi:hypothetical protein GN316_16350 [Xylophilus sp. Kf1]|nr:hypothetical protein [Xylophilus sp. Kf1]